MVTETQKTLFIQVWRAVSTLLDGKSFESDKQNAIVQEILTRIKSYTNSVGETEYSVFNEDANTNNTITIVGNQSTDGKCVLSVKNNSFVSKFEVKWDTSTFIVNSIAVSCKDTLEVVSELLEKYFIPIKDATNTYKIPNIISPSRTQRDLIVYIEEQKSEKEELSSLYTFKNDSKYKDYMQDEIDCLMKPLVSLITDKTKGTVGEIIEQIKTYYGYIFNENISKKNDKFSTCCILGVSSPYVLHPSIFKNITLYSPNVEDESSIVSGIKFELDTYHDYFDNDDFERTLSNGEKVDGFEGFVVKEYGEPKNLNENPLNFETNGIYLQVDSRNDFLHYKTDPFTKFTFEKIESFWGEYLGKTKTEVLNEISNKFGIFYISNKDVVEGNYFYSDLVKMSAQDTDVLQKIYVLYDNNDIVSKIRFEINPDKVSEVDGIIKDSCEENALKNQVLKGNTDVWVDVSDDKKNITISNVSDEPTNDDGDGELKLVKDIIDSLKGDVTIGGIYDKIKNLYEEKQITKDTSKKFKIGYTYDKSKSKVRLQNIQVYGLDHEDSSLASGVEILLTENKSDNTTLWTDTVYRLKSHAQIPASFGDQTSLPVCYPINDDLYLLVSGTNGGNHSLFIHKGDYDYSDTEGGGAVIKQWYSQLLLSPGTSACTEIKKHYPYAYIESNDSSSKDIVIAFGENGDSYKDTNKRKVSKVTVTCTGTNKNENVSRVALTFKDYDEADDVYNNSSIENTNFYKYDKNYYLSWDDETIVLESVYGTNESDAPFEIPNIMTLYGEEVLGCDRKKAYDKIKSTFKVEDFIYSEYDKKGNPTKNATKIDKIEEIYNDKRELSGYRFLVYDDEFKDIISSIEISIYDDVVTYVYVHINKDENGKSLDVKSYVESKYTRTEDEGIYVADDNRHVLSSYKSDKTSNYINFYIDEDYEKINGFEKLDKNLIEVFNLLGQQFIGDDDKELNVDFLKKNTSNEIFDDGKTVWRNYTLEFEYDVKGTKEKHSICTSNILDDETTFINDVVVRLGVINNIIKRIQVDTSDSKDETKEYFSSGLFLTLTNEYPFSQVGGQGESVKTISYKNGEYITNIEISSKTKIDCNLTNTVTSIIPIMEFTNFYKAKDTESTSESLIKFIKKWFDLTESESTDTFTMSKSDESNFSSIQIIYKEEEKKEEEKKEEGTKQADGTVKKEEKKEETPKPSKISEIVLNVKKVQGVERILNSLPLIYTNLYAINSDKSGGENLCVSISESLSNLKEIRYCVQKTDIEVLHDIMGYDDKDDLSAEKLKKDYNITVDTIEINDTDNGKSNITVRTKETDESTVELINIKLFDNYDDVVFSPEELVVLYKPEYVNLIPYELSNKNRYSDPITTPSGSKKYEIPESETTNGVKGLRVEYSPNQSDKLRYYCCFSDIENLSCIFDDEYKSNKEAIKTLFSTNKQLNYLKLSENEKPTTSKDDSFDSVDKSSEELANKTMLSYSSDGNDTKCFHSVIIMFDGDNVESVTATITVNDDNSFIEEGLPLFLRDFLKSGTNSYLVNSSTKLYIDKIEETKDNIVSTKLKYYIKDDNDGFGGDLYIDWSGFVNIPSRTAKTNLMNTFQIKDEGELKTSSIETGSDPHEEIIFDNFSKDSEIKKVTLSYHTGDDTVYEVNVEPKESVLSDALFDFLQKNYNYDDLFDEGGKSKYWVDSSDKSVIYQASEGIITFQIEDNPANDSDSSDNDNDDDDSEDDENGGGNGEGGNQSAKNEWPVNKAMRTAIKRAAYVAQCARVLELMPTPEDFANRLCSEIIYVSGLIQQMMNHVNTLLEEYSNIPTDYINNQLNSIMTSTNNLLESAEEYAKKGINDALGIVESGVQFAITNYEGALDLTTEAKKAYKNFVATVRSTSKEITGDHEVAQAIRDAAKAYCNQLDIDRSAEKLAQENYYIEQYNKWYEKRFGGGDNDNTEPPVDGSDFGGSDADFNNDAFDDLVEMTDSEALYFYSHLTESQKQELIEQTAAEKQINALTKGMAAIVEAKNDALNFVGSRMEMAREEVTSFIQDIIEKIREYVNKMQSDLDSLFGDVEGSKFVSNLGKMTELKNSDKQTSKAVGYMSEAVKAIVENFSLGKVITAFAGVTVNIGLIYAGLSELPAINVEKMLLEFRGKLKKPQQGSIPDDGGVTWDDLIQYDPTSYNFLKSQFDEYLKDERNRIYENKEKKKKKFLQSQTTPEDIFIRGNNGFYNNLSDSQRRNVKTAIKEIKKKKDQAKKAKRAKKVKQMIQELLQKIKNEALRIVEQLKTEWNAMLNDYKKALRDLKNAFTGGGALDQYIEDLCIDINNQCANIIQLCTIDMPTQIGASASKAVLPYCFGAAVPNWAHNIVSFIMDIKTILKFIMDLIEYIMKILDDIYKLAEIFLNGLNKLWEILKQLLNILGLGWLMGLIEDICNLFHKTVDETLRSLEGKLTPIYLKDQLDMYDTLMDDITAIFKEYQGGTSDSKNLVEFLFENKTQYMSKINGILMMLGGSSYVTSDEVQLKYVTDQWDEHNREFYTNAYTKYHDDLIAGNFSLENPLVPVKLEFDDNKIIGKVYEKLDEIYKNREKIIIAYKAPHFKENADKTKEAEIDYYTYFHPNLNHLGYNIDFTDINGNKNNWNTFSFIQNTYRELFVDLGGNYVDGAEKNGVVWDSKSGQFKQMFSQTVKVDIRDCYSDYMYRLYQQTNTGNNSNWAEKTMISLTGTLSETNRRSNDYWGGKPEKWGILDKQEIYNKEKDTYHGDNLINTYELFFWFKNNIKPEDDPFVDPPIIDIIEEEEKDETITLNTEQGSIAKINYNGEERYVWVKNKNLKTGDWVNVEGTLYQIF